MKKNHTAKRAAVLVMTVLFCIGTISIIGYATQRNKTPKSKDGSAAPKFEVKELADYKGLSCTYTKKVVTDQKLELYINEILYNMNYDSEKHEEDDSELYKIELTDEYVQKNLPEYDSAEDFRNECREALEAEYEEDNELSKASHLIGMVVDNSEFEPFDNETLERKVTELKDELEERVKEKDYESVEDYLKKVKYTTYDEYKKTELIPLAENILKYQYVIDEIKKRENLFITDEETEYMKYICSNMYGTDDEEELAIYIEDNREAVERDKVYRFLIKNNTFTPVIEKEEDILSYEN